MNLRGILIAMSGAALLLASDPPSEVRLITLDPAHFHAALVQKDMLPGVSKRVAVFAPLGTDLLEHLARIERFNSRPERPTAWELDIHATARPLAEMLASKPGNVVVISGRNNGKIEKIRASLDAGLNALVDKPWVIRAEDLPALDAALDTADRKGLVAYDMMTERFEVTSILQKELVNDAAVFGTMVPGSEAEPGVSMESVHNIMKTVAGVPNLRPAFFFDVNEQGQAMADVGTHLVDLVQWMLFPNQAIRYQSDIKMVGARRWPTPMTPAQFRQVTGLAAIPAELAGSVHGGQFDYDANGQLRYQLRGIHVRLDILWKWESPSGTDLHHAIFRGTNASVEVRQGEKERFRPELYVVAAPGKQQAVAQALGNCLQRLQAVWPGIAVENSGGELHVAIPERFRVGHEAHFAQVLGQFLEYLKAPKTLPSWERPNMLAKYYVTTTGVRMSQ
jgi:predicted dehydrogenase